MRGADEPCFDARNPNFNNHGCFHEFHNVVLHRRPGCDTLGIASDGYGDLGVAKSGCRRECSH